MNERKEESRLENTINRLHRVLTSSSMLVRVTWATRILLSIGFLSPGLTKLLGRRFVTTVTDDVVGQFFEALYQSGGYWKYLGAAQVIAAILIVFKRTSGLGTVVFLGIITNIVAITISMPFGTTASVAILMLVACIYLMIWEYPKWRPLLFENLALLSNNKTPQLTLTETCAFAAVLVGGWGVTCVMRSLIESNYLVVFWICLIISMVGAATLAIVWILSTFKSIARTIS